MWFLQGITFPQNSQKNIRLSEQTDTNTSLLLYFFVKNSKFERSFASLSWRKVKVEQTPNLWVMFTLIILGMKFDNIYLSSHIFIYLSTQLSTFPSIYWFIKISTYNHTFIHFLFAYIYILTYRFVEKYLEPNIYYFHSYIH